VSLLPALLLTLALQPAEVLSVRSEQIDQRASLRVFTVGELPSLAIRRQGNELLLSLDAVLPQDLPLPPPVAPIASITLSREDSGLTLHVVTSPGVGFELMRERSSVALLFGEVPGEETAADSIRHLYAQIFPVGWGLEESEEALLPEPGAEEDEGRRLGAFSLRPGLVLSYVDADTAVSESPQSVRDSYFQIQPILGVELSPLRNNHVEISYEPRFRVGSAFPIVETTTHLVTARAEIAVGAFTLVRGSYRHARGVLETVEVDPGREYFFGLDQFRRHYFVVGARHKRGGRLDLDASLAWNHVETASESFFDYDRRLATAAVGYELDRNYRAALGYSYEELPESAERPEAAHTAHSAHVTLTGDILPLVTGEAMVGYRWQTNPNAAEAGRDYSGLVLGGDLTKEFSPASRLSLRFNRSPNPSAFQQNGFYVTTAGQADLTLPLPLYFSLRGGVGYHRNAYRTIVPELGEPRQDDIFAWSVGVGRGVTRWAFLRADYRRERRRSNLDAFDVDTDGFIIQLGIGRTGGGMGVP
jgi:hypothetical protein